MTQSAKVSPYDIITDRVCTLLEQGVIPWKKGWSSKVGEEY